MENTISWKEMEVWSDGECVGSLGEMVERFREGDRTFAGLHFAQDGSIRQWPGYFVAAPGEETVAVDWAGIHEALKAVDPLYWL